MADFECFLVALDDGTMSTHVPSACCVYLVTPHEHYRMLPRAYVNNGDGDVMDDFFRYVFDLSKTIDNILSRNIPMRALSDDERREFDRADTHLSQLRREVFERERKNASPQSRQWPLSLSGMQQLQFGT